MTKYVVHKIQLIDVRVITEIPETTKTGENI